MLLHKNASCRKSRGDIIQGATCAGNVCMSCVEAASSQVKITFAHKATAHRPSQPNCQSSTHQLNCLEKKKNISNHQHPSNQQHTYMRQHLLPELQECTHLSPRQHINHLMILINFNRSFANWTTYTCAINHQLYMPQLTRIHTHSRGNNRI